MIYVPFGCPDCNRVCTAAELNAYHRCEECYTSLQGHSKDDRRSYRKYCVEAWTFPSDEEGGVTELEEAAEFASEELARHWAWTAMQEGFQTRLWIR